MGIRTMSEYTCDCCNHVITHDIKPEGWVIVTIRLFDTDAKKVYCKSCTEAIKRANTSAGYE